MMLCSCPLMAMIRIILNVLRGRQALYKSMPNPFHQLLTHVSRETPKRVDPDQTSQNAASDQGLNCLKIV